MESESRTSSEPASPAPCRRLEDAMLEGGANQPVRAGNQRQRNRRRNQRRQPDPGAQRVAAAGPVLCAIMREKCGTTAEETAPASRVITTLTKRLA